MQEKCLEAPIRGKMRLPVEQIETALETGSVERTRPLEKGETLLQKGEMLPGKGGTALEEYWTLPSLETENR